MCVDQMGGCRSLWEAAGCPSKANELTGAEDTGSPASSGVGGEEEMASHALSGGSK